MPLGDPHGGEFEYTDEGLPIGISAVTVPSRGLERSIRFYRDILGMEIIGQEQGRAYLRRTGCTIILVDSDDAGVDLGFYLTVDDPYSTRRRLIDEGVEFMCEPRRGPLGTFTAIFDPDRNIIRMIEPSALFRS